MVVLRDQIDIGMKLGGVVFCCVMNALFGMRVCPRKPTRGFRGCHTYPSAEFEFSCWS